MSNRIKRTVSAMFILVLYGLSYNSFMNGGMFNVLNNYETKMMFAEMLIVFVLSYLINKTVKNKLYIYGMLFVIIFLFSYLHQMFLPIVVNMLYMIFIFSIGYALCKATKVELNYWIAFIIGISCIILLECILCILNIGEIKYFAYIIVFTGILSSLYCVKDFTVFISKRVDSNILFYRENAMLIASVMVVFVLLIGRCNLAIDYDGLWYGLKPDIILNSGNGIYDRILQISIPNTYPKGYEILILPLSLLPSYSFMTAFNIFIGILILLIICDICKVMGIEERSSVIAILASIPGIMSMCTTVKQDSITLLFQLIMLYFAIRLLKDKSSNNLWLLFAAYLISINMKTTALVFSSIILIVLIVFIIRARKEIVWQIKELYIVLLAGLVLLLLMARTYILCGYPYTSLLNGVWEFLGLASREPYIIAAPTDSIGLGEILSVSGIINAIKKGITAFVLPIQFSNIITSHLLMTWGTSLTFIAFIFILFSINLKKWNTELEIKKFVVVLYGVVVMASLYSVASLNKNDGNYYMLLYVLSLITVFSCSASFKAIMRNRIVIGLIIGANIVVFSLTGWAGAGRFSHIQLKNEGFYNHKEEFENQMVASGKSLVINYFSEKDVDKVLAFGDISIVNRLPCLVENITEIVAYGGQEYIATYDDFVRLLRDTNVSEIYIDNTYDYADRRLTQYFCMLIENKMIDQILCENENYILVISEENGMGRLSTQDGKNFIQNIQEMKIIDGALYSDGWMGKIVIMGWDTVREYVGFSIYNPEEIDEQIIVCKIGEESYTYSLKAGEMKNITIQVPTDCFSLEIMAQKTFKPLNGDNRDLSVLLTINKE